MEKVEKFLNGYEEFLINKIMELLEKGETYESVFLNLKNFQYEYKESKIYKELELLLNKKERDAINSKIPYSRMKIKTLLMKAMEEERISLNNHLINIKDSKKNDNNQFINKITYLNKFKFSIEQQNLLKEEECYFDIVMALQNINMDNGKPYIILNGIHFQIMCNQKEFADIIKGYEKNYRKLIKNKTISWKLFQKCTLDKKSTPVDLNEASKHPSTKEEKIKKINNTINKIFNYINSMSFN